MKTIVRILFKVDTMAELTDLYLGPAQCGPDVAKVEEYKYGKGKIGLDIEINLKEGDERIAKICALLTQHGEYHSVDRDDFYTEEELQNARLLCVGSWTMYQVGGGLQYGTTYDLSNACKQCGTGVRQTSPLVIDGDVERSIEKMHVAGTHHADLMVHDVLGEKLAQAKLTGLNLWPVYSLRKGGTKVEMRREQIFAENVLPPMAPASSLDRSEVCSVCQRGRFNFVFQMPVRIVYRAEDLKNTQDVNLTWEWIGASSKLIEDPLAIGMWPHPLLLVTPKVMNLLRGKTKKEKKYEGVSFTPIWIEDEKTGQVKLG
jgi:hypothetical protein